MTIADWIKLALEYLAGEQDDPPPGFPATLGAWWFWAAFDLSPPTEDTDTPGYAVTMSNSW